MSKYPKIGIRPTIDGRQGGVRESLEEKTMNLAKAVAELISANVKHADGTPVECVIADGTILHNLREGVEYPATLVTTGDHDDRVVPAHSFKFAAELQHCHKGENPVLIRIDTNAGHGAGKPTSKRIEEIADTFAFIFENTDTKYKK